MSRKVIPIISVVILTIFAGFFFFESNTLDEELMQETFDFDAIYYEDQQTIEIIFSDKSQKTSKVVLEILGMQESFQKTFTGSQFTERIPFEGTPAFGWEIHPVTLVVEHNEFGKVGLKTEIHSQDEPALPIIYSPL